MESSGYSAAIPVFPKKIPDVSNVTVRLYLRVPLQRDELRVRRPDQVKEHEHVHPLELGSAEAVVAVGGVLQLLGEVPGAVDAVRVRPFLNGLLPVQEQQLERDVR